MNRIRVFRVLTFIAEMEQKEYKLPLKRKPTTHALDPFIHSHPFIHSCRIWKMWNIQHFYIIIIPWNKPFVPIHPFSTWHGIPNKFKTKKWIKDKQQIFRFPTKCKAKEKGKHANLKWMKEKQKENETLFVLCAYSLRRRISYCKQLLCMLFFYRVCQFEIVHSTHCEFGRFVHSIRSSNTPVKGNKKEKTISGVDRFRFRSFIWTFFSICYLMCLVVSGQTFCFREARKKLYKTDIEQIN